MHALILAGLLICSTYVAPRASAAPSVTGGHLVKLLQNADPATVTWSADSPFRTRAIAAEFQDLSNGTFVHGFIQGVHAATEGNEWCPGVNVRPLFHEMEAEARHSLQRMPDTQLKRNAADLIVEVWRKTWPCATKRRAP